METLAPLFLQTLFSAILADLHHGVLSPAATFLRVHRHLVSIPTDLGPRVAAWSIRHRSLCCTVLLYWLLIDKPNGRVSEQINRVRRARETRHEEILGISFQVWKKEKRKGNLLYIGVEPVAGTKLDLDRAAIAKVPLV